MVNDEVAVVLAEVPEFLGPYLELVVWADGDPGAAACFIELADYVAALAEEVERFRPLLVRCLAAAEKVAETSLDAEELIVWAFLDNLSPDDVRRLDHWMGPHTRSLMDDADLRPAGDFARGGQQDAPPPRTASSEP